MPKFDPLTVFYMMKSTIRRSRIGDNPRVHLHTASRVEANVSENIGIILRDAIHSSSVPYRLSMNTIKCLLEVDKVN